MRINPYPPQGGLVEIPRGGGGGGGLKIKAKFSLIYLVTFLKWMYCPFVIKKKNITTYTVIHSFQ